MDTVKMLVLVGLMAACERQAPAEPLGEHGRIGEDARIPVLNQMNCKPWLPQDSVAPWASEIVIDASEMDGETCFILLNDQDLRTGTYEQDFVTFYIVGGTVAFPNTLAHKLAPAITNPMHDGERYTIRYDEWRYVSVSHCGGSTLEDAWCERDR